MSDRSVADILDKAADHIVKHGWIQGDFAATYIDEAMECAVCARGGISVAAGCHPVFTEEPDEWAAHPVVFTADDDDWTHLGPEDQAALNLIQATEQALAAHLRSIGVTLSADHGGDAVSEWNDAPGRTAEQVVAELRACAADLRAGAS
jgi:hypothetical protein